MKIILDLGTLENSKVTEIGGKAGDSSSQPLLLRKFLSLSINSSLPLVPSGMRFCRNTAVLRAAEGNFILPMSFLLSSFIFAERKKEGKENEAAQKKMKEELMDSLVQECNGFFFTALLKLLQQGK